MLLCCSNKVSNLNQNLNLRFNGSNVLRYPNLEFSISETDFAKYHMFLDQHQCQPWSKSDLDVFRWVHNSCKLISL